MAVVGMMVNQVKMVGMDQKEKMVILVMLVHVVTKDIVIITLGAMDLMGKLEIMEKRYVNR